MDWKLISKFIKLGVVFVIISLLFSFVIYKGANHPPLRFYDIVLENYDYVEEMARKQHEKTTLTLNAKGPFDWDNDHDLGMSSTLGIWDCEDNDMAIVYFKRDKDAVTQARAQAILKSFEDIIWEIDSTFDIDFPNFNANGRRIPVYLASDTEEYHNVLNILCNGSKSPRGLNACSVVEMGPLGILCRGIVINQDEFGYDRNGAPAFEKGLRREIARYAYLSNVELDEYCNENEWIADGFVEFFANMHCIDELITPEMSRIDTNTVRSGSFAFTGKQGTDAAASFLDFYRKTFGIDSLSEMINYSFENNISDFFTDNGMDINSLKMDWCQYIHGILDSKSQAQTQVES